MSIGNYYKTHEWFKQLVDQTAHLLGAMLLLCPAIWGHLWASALLIGLLREVEQIRAKAKAFDESWSANYRTGTIGFYDPWRWSWRRALDVAFWFAGGLALSAIVWLT